MPPRLFDAERHHISGKPDERRCGLHHQRPAGPARHRFLPRPVLPLCRGARHISDGQAHPAPFGGYRVRTGALIRRLREAALPYSDCVAAQFRFEYVLNMAQIYEIPAADRTAGRQLFANAREVLSGDRDRLIRLLRLLLRLTGLTATAYLLHTAKKFRRTLKHGKKGKTA